MVVRKQLAKQLEERIDQVVRRRKVEEEKIARKHELFAKRNAEIVKVMATGKVLSRNSGEEFDDIHYRVHLKYLIKQPGKIYIEEEIENRQAAVFKETIVEDREIAVQFPTGTDDLTFFYEENSEENRSAFTYNRLEVVRYAEKWWDNYNPAYEAFEVDCTNYVSQCIHAGGAPMRGYPNRSKGWWYQNKNWSYSWSVANALKNHLGSSTIGLRAKEVKDPRELQLGDVICYDFQGDGRFDHNTIVTGKDAAGEPLVNAHTYNSRMRYWAYEDSTAYTPNIQYKMYTIIDDA
ncbi:amidase domain-containing protein [Bacillus niameyensis]|uniref:amidase domain-containing protein n=1 Tax=Bacillus niameyensis TaxID=1522308 RepID=UPI0038993389